MKYLFVILLYMYSILCGWMFYDLYWKRRECFNEEGRCLETETGIVYLQQSGLVWGSFTILAFLSATFIIYIFKQSK